ncbi:MAG: L,D-transpeptidase [Mycobacterium leprae]
MRNTKLMLIACVLGLTAILSGCQTGTAANGNKGESAGTAAVAALAKAFGPVDQKIEIGQGFVVLGPLNNGSRELAYLTKSGSSYALVGQRVVLTQEADTAKLEQDGTLVVVETAKGDQKSPQFAAYTAGTDGLKPVDYYAAKAPEPAVKSGTFILVNKYLNVLYLYRDGKLVKEYRVATGRDYHGTAPTWQDYATNFFTPEGTFKVTDFKVNPPFNALKPGDQSFAGGAPGNPLGTRWMGFSVLPNDGAGLWGIHGTSHPEQIGTWASDGCIRLQTQNAEELFGLIKDNNPTLQVIHQ